MFKKEIDLILWLGRAFTSVIVLFFVIPALILLTLGGIITGITWKIILGAVLAYLVFLSIVKVAMYFFNKKWEKEIQQQMQKENDVKYVIIK
ncbi:hypothetical protein Q7306_07270 [Glaesserella parasuis]|uniref:Uncharacterized protein n=1 Tax=Glaesserella parasuis serovar 5 (strain SH0165) TaxID=557723 RepID=B8F4J6_GLAP5|nr:hypothetical protein [Glaesserella parasuis]ACL32248.1 hypothetical protein HAPS_0595 [Glaesserella parasuis SH0165]ATW44990.1 hypothetical protein A2U21_03055 [Glaesserella parasuis str. Nagasaki]AWY45055.1 hypothetical protein B4U42_03225 [Glaesserella parasuis 29755]EMY46534.1 hypothetical protein OE7_04022 [Glaesserella parasuis gx033]EQA00073.1 putative membrane protein [Glaesserella parasuis str. Nagasaki]